MKVSPFAGKPAEPSMLVNVPRLVTAYYCETPDASVPSQRVAFGTSGHRGSALDKAFNEWHILAIGQAICLSRARQKIDGPLFLGMDTHALSVPAVASALEVLAAGGVEVMLAEGDEYTPTPAISHAILTYKRGRKTGLANGIVITPAHNPLMTAGSNTIRHTAPRRSQSSRTGSRRRQTSFSKVACGAFKGFLTRRRCGPPQPTDTTTSTPTREISPKVTRSL